MKLIRVANKTLLSLSRLEWEEIGLKQGWTKEAGLFNNKPKVTTEPDFGLANHIYKLSLKDRYWQEAVKLFDQYQTDKLHVAMAVKYVFEEMITQYADIIKKFLKNPFMSDATTQEKFINNLRSMIKQKLETNQN